MNAGKRSPSTQWLDSLMDSISPQAALLCDPSYQVPATPEIHLYCVFSSRLSIATMLIFCYMLNKPL
jgi:hypothetical protein